jgi:hypothetical protein
MAESANELGRIRARPHHHFARLFRRSTGDPPLWRILLPRGQAA